MFFGSLTLALAVPYVVVALMPSWRRLLLCLVSIGGLLAFGWFEQIALWMRSDFSEERLPLSEALLEVATITFIAGVVVRGLSLAGNKSTSRWATRAKLSLFGFIMLLAALALPAASLGSLQWPPSAACQRANFSVDLAGRHFEIPAAPLFEVFVGRTPAQETYDVSRPASLRQLCLVTQSGRHQIHIAGISIKFHQALLLGRSLCGSNADGLQAPLCVAISVESGESIDKIEFPVSAMVLSLTEVDLGAFGTSASSFEESLSGGNHHPGDIFVRSVISTPDGKPLTFRCSGPDNGSYFCAAAYPWRGQTLLSYTFRSNIGDVAERGTRIDTMTREFVGKLLAQSPH